MEYLKILKQVAKERKLDEAVVRQIANAYYGGIKEIMNDENAEHDKIYMRFFGTITKRKPKK